MTLRWTPSAARDMEAVSDFLEETSPEARTPVLDAIVRAVEKLREYPLMGRPGRRRETRELVIARTPFLVWYRERGAHVEVLRVVHGRMKWPPRVRR